MAVYTDDFEGGTTGQDLDVYDSTWVDVGPNADSIQISDLSPGRGLEHDTGTNGGYYYNQTFNEKHYSELEILSDGSLGPCVRGQAGGNFFYCYAGTGAVYNGETISGTPEDWDGGQSGISVNDVVALWVDETTSTTIIYKVNDSTIQTYTGKGNLTGGRPGVTIYFSGQGDNWEGGDVVTAAPAPNITDDATLTDSITLDVSDPQIASQDDATLADSSTVSIQAVTPASIDNQDDATLTDLVTVAVSAPEMAIADNNTLTDSVTVQVEDLGEYLELFISPLANYIQVVTP